MPNCRPRWSRVQAIAIVTALAVTATLASVSIARAEESRSGKLLFTQQDAVQAFDLKTGQGYQIGTVTGLISGTSFVEFQFVPLGPPVGDVLPIAFQNKVILTDIDGDQLFFDNDGTGSFHLGIPGADFRGSGGPLTGGYVVTGATGKYADWVGHKYQYRAIATNPPSPPGSLGNVYVTVSRLKRADK